ncbi:MAG: hypothetical protein SX243_23565 [Acidobacteriota bacterium]|nr:hypothetical protein [Acidobacteriota bacterium]
MRNYITTVAVAAGGASAAAGSRYLIDDLSLSPGSALAVSTLLAILVYRGLEILLVVVPLRWRWARRILDVRARFEGIWISRTDKEGSRYYNYITLSYEPSAEDFSISGISFGNEDEHHSSWAGANIEFDLKKPVVRFFYEASVHEADVEDVLGFASIKFQGASSGSFTSGAGHIVDTGSSSKKYPIVFNRLEAAEMKDLVGMKKVATIDQKQSLLRAYRKQHPNF